MAKNLPKPLITDPSNPNAATNARIFNTVASQAKKLGLTFADRVPNATQGDMQATIDYMDSYMPAWNDWLEVLLNGLVIDLFRVNDFQNPLGRHKIAGIQTNGSWIREFGYNLMKAHRYDKDATDVFTVEEPEVHTNYYLQNRKDRYDLSISEDILRQAMMESETGVATLINNMLALPYTSAEEDEYLIMRELFAMRDRENPFYNVHIEDISNADDKQKTGLDIAQKIREKYLDFPFLHTEYNPEGLPAKTNDPVLFVTPRFLANFDVNVLASAFNMDKTNFMGRVETVDRLPLDNVPYGSAALLADPDIFVCADTKVKSASIQNPKNDSVNYFLHRWGIYGMSKFVNAVLFSPRPDTGEDITVVPTVTDVTVAFASINGATPEYATKGTTTRLTATVTGTNDPSQAVSWDIAGTSGLTKSTNTFVRGDGELWVGTDEQNDWLLLRATSITDPTKQGLLRVGIGKKASAPEAVTAITINGSATVKAGTTSAYTATVTGDPNNGVVWTLIGAPDNNTNIDANGLLTVAASVPADTKLTVMAVSRLKPDVNSQMQVTVSAASGE